MNYFSKFNPLLVAYRRTNWKTTSVLFVLILVSVQTPQIQRAPQDVEALERFEYGWIFDFYAVYYPVFSFDKKILTELTELRDKLADIDNQNDNMNFTAMYFSNQALELSSGKPVLLMFSSELENEIIVSSRLNFSITEQMLADVNLATYTVQYTEEYLPTPIQLDFVYQYEFTYLHFWSNYTQNGVNYTSYNFMVLPWKELPILEQLPVVGNISFAEFWGPWNGKVPKGSKFRDKVEEITQQVTREVQFFSLESESYRIIYNTPLIDAIKNYEYENWTKVLESIGTYFFNSAMLVGLMVLATREQRRQLEKTVEILNIRGFERKRSSMSLFLIFATNILMIGSIVMLVYFVIGFIELKTNQTIAELNDYIIMNLSILTVLVTVVAFISWKMSLKISPKRIFRFINKGAGMSKSLPAWLERNKLKLLAGIILLTALLPLTISWTKPSSTMNDMMRILMIGNSILIVAFYREIPMIKKRRIQVVGTIIKKPGHLAPYRSWILLALLLLSMAGLTRNYDFKEEKFMPGDIRIYPIADHNLSFQDVKNLSTWDEINQAVPFTLKGGKIGFDSIMVVVIDFDALANLIDTSNGFTQRVYHPFFAKDIWRQMDMNDVIVTGPLAVKENLDVNDNIKLTFGDGFFESFETVVQVQAITSSIQMGSSVFSELMFLSKDLYMKVTGMTEMNMTAFGLFLDVKNDLQTAEGLYELIETIEEKLETRFPYSTIYLSPAIDPQGKIMRQNGWGFGSAYYLGKQQLENNYILNHFWFFMVLLPAATVLLNIIDVETLAVLHQRGLNKKRFLEQYRRAELIGVMLSALSIGAAYFSWRMFWLLSGSWLFDFTTHPSIPWLFERELLKVIAWSLGYAMVGGGIIYYKFKRYEVQA
ncbi:MAG: hypothetical protein D6732_16930 [Methanobacteriota archaeon]|nr:MAG: hypothetical protein D6732_16930 [Euryarchaeota archaeon]